MDSTKFLVTGANGQLGNALRQQYPDAHFTDAAELDITNKEVVENFDWSNITHIINAAAYTNVDGAEVNQDLCRSINVDGVANLVAAANTHNLTLVHISTDYVFDGTKDNHTEDEELSPISIYGRSKADGDKEALKASKHYILRTSWVIGEGHNFVRIMMGLAEKNISPTVVKDQVGRLTFTSELV
ncbi:NAD(P)-dependent oxidoreductase, partial [Candidatus Saccharibacteria bacterium]|nr:NAD(P)-dependent oxidoreductase [Candidatus Saccharibacteria bacterium]